MRPRRGRCNRNPEVPTRDVALVPQRRHFRIAHAYQIDNRYNVHSSDAGTSTWEAQKLAQSVSDLTTCITVRIPSVCPWGRIDVQ